MLNFAVGTTPADGLEPSGVGPSAGAVMIKCKSCMYQDLGAPQKHLWALKSMCSWNFNFV